MKLFYLHSIILLVAILFSCQEQTTSNIVPKETIPKIILSEIDSVVITYNNFRPWDGDTDYYWREWTDLDSVSVSFKDFNIKGDTLSSMGKSILPYKLLGVGRLIISINQKEGNINYIKIQLFDNYYISQKPDYSFSANGDITLIATSLYPTDESGMIYEYSGESIVDSFDI